MRLIHQDKYFFGFIDYREFLKVDIFLERDFPLHHRLIETWFSLLLDNRHCHPVASASSFNLLIFLQHREDDIRKLFRRKSCRKIVAIPAQAMARTRHKLSRLVSRILSQYVISP